MSSEYNFPEMPLSEWAQVNVADLVRRRKHNARKLLSRAVKLGRVKREPCLDCADTESEAHHPDYCYPLQVIWLCRIHHMALHKRAWSVQREFRKLTTLRPIEEILRGL